MTEDLRSPSRRALLRAGLALGCSAAAFPLMSRVTFASAPGENRLVAIVLRGALDGLAAVAPYGDPHYRALRPTLAVLPENGAIDLDGRFALHPALAPLAPLWRRGELAFAHAVSTPYRDKRSHFDGQDALETGSGAADGPTGARRDGWLNRALSLMPGAEARTAVAVGRERMLLLEGDAPALGWAPDGDLRLSEPALHLLERVLAQDPLFAEAGREAIMIDRELDAGGMERARRVDARALAALAARMLSAESRIAAFSLGGFDTHKGQAGAIRRPLEQLAEAIEALRQGLGPNWARTTVLCMTEFGRTAHENGTRGTDHGTGGVMLFAGGALSGARAHGRWPGLAEGDLYQGRDLMPTDDLRRYAAWALRGAFGLPRDALERTVFPGLDMGADPRLLA
ncbi:DUF1501 domain-containing protein [Oceanicella actignis]|uniref:DUF1501 domain-containing protein n=1 Tax=Oceanicella actignis TaxID=1189325 RepID=UPI0011E77287|nr:DUF1501 domain-containing protein [Oceanicella actignis]TYO89464.1 uncharacterized protein (DUF1501 family) [Oceanicella actignis]